MIPQFQLSKIFERKIAIIFLPISLNMCFGCSKEPSHLDGSFEYPQHMFWLRNKKNNLQLSTLTWGPGYMWANNFSIKISLILVYSYNSFLTCFGSSKEHQQPYVLVEN